MKKILLLLAASAAAFAGTVSYQVTVDTTGLGSGFVEFQFNPGSAGGQSATASLFGFVPLGGLSGSPSTSGAATGTLAGNNVVLTNTAGANPNSYLQGITFGNTLSFIVTFAGPLLNTPANTGVDTAFFLSFYSPQGDFLLANGPILQIDLFSNGGTSATVFVDGATADTVIPEPAAIGLLALGLGIFALRRRLAA